MRSPKTIKTISLRITLTYETAMLTDKEEGGEIRGSSDCEKAKRERERDRAVITVRPEPEQEVAKK
jgi:hypothetical protein